MTRIVFAPAYVFFVKVFEERELEIRFGASYLEYKSRTPTVFPKKTKELNDTSSNKCAQPTAAITVLTSGWLTRNPLIPKLI